MQKRTHINLSNEYLVNVQNVLGKGSTGIVCEGYDLRNQHERVAVKIIDLRTIDNEVTEYLLKMEKLALASLQNEYTLKCYKISQNKKYCFMVTEYCNGGTLKNYIKESNLQGYLSQEESFKLIRCLLQGYHQLVKKKIVHRDLKPANIMMHSGFPKIIDFGYCEVSGHKKPSLQYNVGSPSYMAPQSYKLSIYNEKTQIWAMGVILFECLTGKTIDQGRQMTDTYKEIKEKGVPYPPHLSEKAKKLIDWCLRINPTNRPTCEELLNSQFFSSKNSTRRLVPSASSIQDFGHQRIVRPQSQYQKPQSVNSRYDQLTLTKSNHIPNIECLQQSQQKKSIKAQLPFKRQTPKYYQNKLISYTDRVVPNHPQSRLNAYQKNSEKIFYSKYQQNRFKPSITVFKNEKVQNTNKRYLQCHKTKVSSEYQDQKYFMKKIEQKTKINYGNIEGEKENRNKFASYHYSANESVPQKKYSVRIPAQNPWRIGIRDFGKNGQMDRVKQKSVYQIQSQQMHRM